MITEADHGDRIVVTSDARVHLRLDSAYVWEEPRADGESVELVRVDYFQDPGFVEWELHPTAPGTTVITTTGECAPGSECPEDRLDLEITVIVED